MEVRLGRGQVIGPGREVEVECAICFARRRVATGVVPLRLRRQPVGPAAARLPRVELLQELLHVIPRHPLGGSEPRPTSTRVKEQLLRRINRPSDLFRPGPRSPTEVVSLLKMTAPWFALLLRSYRCLLRRVFMTGRGWNHGHKDPRTSLRHSRLTAPSGSVGSRCRQGGAVAHVVAASAGLKDAALVSPPAFLLTRATKSSLPNRHLPGKSGIEHLSANSRERLRSL